MYLSYKKYLNSSLLPSQQEGELLQAAQLPPPPHPGEGLQDDMEDDDEDGPDVPHDEMEDHDEDGLDVPQDDKFLSMLWLTCLAPPLLHPLLSPQDSEKRE